MQCYFNDVTPEREGEDSSIFEEGIGKQDEVRLGPDGDRCDNDLYCT